MSFSSFSFSVPSAAKAPLWSRAGLDMFRDPATEARLQAAFCGLMGVTSQLHKVTGFFNSLNAAGQAWAMDRSANR